MDASNVKVAMRLLGPRTSISYSSKTLNLLKLGQVSLVSLVSLIPLRDRDLRLVIKPKLGHIKVLGQTKRRK